MPDEPVKVWASLGQTINTGNFNNIKIDIGVSGIPTDCTEAAFQEIMRGAHATLEKVVFTLADQLAQRVKDVKDAQDNT